MRIKLLNILSFLLFLLFSLCVNSGPAIERTDTVDPLLRVDCGPDPNINQGICESRGCSWSPITGNFDKTIPWCHYPKNTGYTVARTTSTGFRLTKADSSPGNPFGGDTSDINFDQYPLGDAVRLVIAADASFEPTLDLNKNAIIKSEDPLVLKTTNAEIFSFTVERKNSGVRIWDTSIGGMLFGKQYIQLATMLPTNKIYGFGEHTHQSLQHDLSKYTTWPLFARDQPPNFDSPNTMNLYGVHNFYMGLEDDGKAHGVFVLNTNAQEVTTGPGPHLIYRAIGGRFEIFFFPGPKPEDVIRQYQQVIGQPYLPAYWAFGYQLARYGFKSLDDLKSCVKRITDAKIPFDTIMPDIDYMDRYKDFTLNPNNGWSDLTTYAKQMKASGMHVTIMLDAAIQVDYDSFQRAMNQGANFISWPRADLVQRDINSKYPLTKDTDYMLGVVWPDNHIGFPDFYDDTNATNKWWSNEIKRFHDSVGFDGIWIDMNEPSNFGTNKDHPWYYDNPDHPNDPPLFCQISGDDSKLDFPPYRTQAAYLYGGFNGLLCDNTVCMNGVVNRGKQSIYDVKNLFGLKETIATQKALFETTGKRGQVVGRSTFPSHGRYGGKWLGDNSAKFEALRSAIIGAQEFNLFGIPHVGSDVCGFLFVTTEELCLRWHQLGAFHSFYRNHNDIKSPDQDPPQWPSVAAATRTANLFRYEHLPYLYSLHFAASKLGGTVVRPIFFEFPTDFQTFSLSYQFMWGPAILVAPVVHEGVDSIDAYLPQDAEWYPLYGNSYGIQAKTGHGIFEAPRNSSAPVFVRGGYIVPRQEAGLTTMASHENEFRLLIALNTKVSPVGSAIGELYWDDGVSGGDPSQSMDDFEHYHFTFNYTSTNKQGQIVIQLVKQPTTKLYLPALDQIEIFGYPSNISFKNVKVNGNDAKLSMGDSSYDPVTKILRLQRPGAGIVFLNDHLDSWTITWPNA